MIKRNYKLIVGIIIGAILTGTTVYAATIISSINVGYSNESSNLVADNVQDAIDEVYDKSFNKDLITAYEYSEEDPKCINGEEKTCVKTDCYKKGKTCSQGTVIKYYVKENEYHYFYVLHDNGTTITMQQRENTVRNIIWNEKDSSSSKGPLIILKALEQATSTWTNVNVLEYTPGVTELNGNKFTGCTLTEDKKIKCEDNNYILETKKVRARMITALEVVSTGCKYDIHNTCPDFMFNYLYNSINFGGSYNDNTLDESGEYNFDYWTMSVSISASYHDAIWIVRRAGDITYDTMIANHMGARAVVEINKT